MSEQICYVKFRSRPIWVLYATGHYIREHSIRIVLYRIHVACFFNIYAKWAAKFVSIKSSNVKH